MCIYIYICIYIYTLLYIIYTYSHSYINVIYIICILYIHCVQLHECKSISASHPVLGLGNGPNNVRSRRRRCLPSLVLFAKRFIIHLLSSIHVCVWVFGAQAHLHPSASFWGWNLESCSFKKTKRNAWQSVWTLELVQVPWPSPTKSRKFCWGLLTGSFSTSRIECFGTVRNWRPSRIERLLDRPHSTADPGELLQASLVWSIDQSDFWEIGSPPGPHSVRWRPYRVSLIRKRAYILHTRSWADHMEVTSLNGRRANGHRSAQRPNENLEHKLLRS